MAWVLFVEGIMEKDGLGRLICNKGISKPRKIINLRGRGNFFNEGFRKKLQEYSDYRVFALVDLHPKEENCSTSAQLKERLREWAGDHRDFHPFVAVHDIEAWILGDPDVIRGYLRGLSFSPPREPEGIDFDKPPKKYISELFRKRKKIYKEAKDGVNMLERIDPERVMNVCPSFKEFWWAVIKNAENEPEAGPGL